MNQPKHPARRRIYHRRGLRNRNPFNAAWVMDQLAESRTDLKKLRKRLRAFIENDALWTDIEIAVEAQRRIREVEL